MYTRVSTVSLSLRTTSSLNNLQPCVLCSILKPRNYVNRDYNRRRLVVICKWISRQYVTAMIVLSGRDAVFKTVSSHLYNGLKQSAPLRAKSANHLGLTATSSSPPVASVVHVETRAAINPAGRALNRGKHFILFRSPRGYYVCRPASRGKCWANGRREDNERGGQLRGLMALHLLSPALTRVHNALLCPSDYSDDPTANIPLPLSFSIFHHPRHNKFLSSINRLFVYFCQAKRLLIHNESLNI